MEKLGYQGDLYRVKLDGTCKEKLTNDDIYDDLGYLNIVGDWAYCTDRFGKICKMNLKNVRDKVILTNDMCFSINVVGGWIYYQNVNENLKVYKIKTDGTQKTMVNVDFSILFNVTGGWIYYPSNTGIVKAGTDGRNRVQICGDPASNINVSGNWIYYANISDAGKLYRIGIDGRNWKKLCDARVNHINIAGDWVFYDTDFSGYGEQYRMRAN
jgi:phage pi2 protein 07